MPVTKYRSVMEMPSPPTATERDLAERIRAVWNRAFLVCPPRPPRGVTRFASVERANAARTQATLERMRDTAPR